MIELTDPVSTKEECEFALETLRKYKVPHEVRPYGKRWVVFVEEAKDKIKNHSERGEI